MKGIVVIAACLACASCGVETASTAATSAAIKKRELDAGKKSFERAEQKIGQSLEAQQQRAASTAERADK